MSSVTVENLAKIIGSEGQALLSQMKEAGLNHTDISDEVTDQDKKTLLEFLKEQQTKSSKTISLNKTASRVEPERQGTVSITRKTISKDIAGIVSGDTQRTSATINFDEIEKKRQAGEANKKAEEEKRKKELEQKTLVTRRKAKTQRENVWVVEVKMPRRYVDEFDTEVVQAAEDSYIDTLVLINVFLPCTGGYRDFNFKRRCL